MADKINEAFSSYIKDLQKELATGDATELTHRPALKTLVQSIVDGILATNEPKHIKNGAPDLRVRKGELTIGYIETKDIGKSLDEAEKSEQLKRYFPLGNIILTDYLEFRWYIDGTLRLSASLGTQTQGKIKQNIGGIEKTTELIENFLEHKAKNIGTPKELAIRMAKLAHIIRNLIINTFENETEKGNLHSQLEAFRNNLIPDLKTDQFADMYAQTIAYGLFAAWCTSKNPNKFTRFEAIQNLPKTNPFLRKTFQYIAGYDLDESIVWAVDDLAQILAQADQAGILESFGKQTGKEDAVVHFYETFVKAYDPKVREMRGVYYTPEPVVSYIVRSIDYLLKTHFNKPRGLADPAVNILDPATGTATFLYMVISEIFKSFAGQEGMWDEYVKEKLLKRIFGFELLMAPYAIAHLKLGLQLENTGYKFKSDQRLGVYLTNTLEEAFRKSEKLAGFNEYIIDEANEAAEIKKEKPIMVVLGNPPYSGISANASIKMVTDQKTGKTKKELTWIGKLIEDYKMVDGQPLHERKHWLQNDYVKFLRFGQWRIEHTKQGILGFITDNSYLDSPTFRGMRQSLINSFNYVYILNLHGNSNKKESSPEGNKDENVFDIQQGVAICLLIKEPDDETPAEVYYADLWGLQEAKYQSLLQTDVNDTPWKTLSPNSPYYFFIPRDETLKPEYDKGWKMSELFSTNTNGIVTARDSIVIDFSSKELINRIAEFANPSINDDDLRNKYFGNKTDGKYLPGDTRGWKLSQARKKLQKEPDLSRFIKSCLYRPFDVRKLYYTDCMVDWPRTDIMKHLIHDNRSIICPRRVETVGGWQHVFCGVEIIDHVTVSLKTVDYLFPLYLFPTKGEMDFNEGKRRSNLNPEFIMEFSSKLDLKFIEDGKGDLKETYGPEDIFNYAYAVFHSPTYRTRYAEFLKIDFPRLPLTSDKALFKKMTEKGGELVSLHLMESETLDKIITKYPVKGDNKIEKIIYNEKETRVYINAMQYFEGIPPEVWNFHVGGYQVCEKWIKDRKGRTLSYDELTHYQKVVIALKETIKIMAEIDKIIPSWPIQ